MPDMKIRLKRVDGKVVMPESQEQIEASKQIIIENFHRVCKGLIEKVQTNSIIHNLLEKKIRTEETPLTLHVSASIEAVRLPNVDDYLNANIHIFQCCETGFPMKFVCPVDEEIFIQQVNDVVRFNTKSLVSIMEALYDVLDDIGASYGEFVVDDELEISKNELNGTVWTLNGDLTVNK